MTNLSSPQSLLETHDSVASKNYETPPPSPCSFMDAALNNQPVPPDAVRMVGIRKVSGEHLVSWPVKWNHFPVGSSSILRSRLRSLTLWGDARFMKLLGDKMMLFIFTEQ